MGCRQSPGGNGETHDFPINVNRVSRIGIEPRVLPSVCLSYDFVVFFLSFFPSSSSTSFIYNSLLLFFLHFSFPPIFFTFPFHYLSSFLRFMFITFVHVLLFLSKETYKLIISAFTTRNCKKCGSIVSFSICVRLSACTSLRRAQFDIGEFCHNTRPGEFQFGIKSHNSKNHFSRTRACMTTHILSATRD